MAVASGGLTDVWRGDLDDTRVAIKAFRIYPAQSLKEAKEVSQTVDHGSAPTKEIYRFFGNGYPFGGGYPIPTFYHSWVST